jgi:hypothetical protein
MEILPDEDVSVPADDVPMSHGRPISAPLRPRATAQYEYAMSWDGATYAVRDPAGALVNFAEDKFLALYQQVEVYDCNGVLAGGFEKPFATVQTIYRVTDPKGLVVALVRVPLLEWNNLYLLPCTNGPQANGFDCRVDEDGPEPGAAFKFHKALWSVSERWTVERLKPADNPVYDEFWADPSFIEQMIVRLSTDGTNWCVVGIVLAVILSIVAGYALISCARDCGDSCPARCCAGIFRCAHGTVKCVVDSFARLCGVCCRRSKSASFDASKRHAQTGWFSKAEPTSSLPVGYGTGQGPSGPVEHVSTPLLPNGDIDHNAAVSAFRDATGADSATAAEFLGSRGWDVQRAADAFFERERSVGGSDRAML